jgi:hypothetical protein
MPNSTRLPFVTFLILILAEFAFAEVVVIEVAIKSVDAKGRTISATRKGKTLELDVSRNAEVIINGEAGALEALAAGQTAKIDYETTLEIITKIEAFGDTLAAPELLVLWEIATSSHESGVWLSPDGLTIYWHSTGDDGKWVWTAKRKLPNRCLKTRCVSFPDLIPRSLVTVLK